MNGGASQIYGEVGLHSLGDPLFLILFFLTFMFICIGGYLGYYFGKGIERTIDYVKGNSDQDWREDRQDDKPGPSIGYTPQVQSGRRFGDCKNRRRTLYSSGKSRTKT